MKKLEVEELLALEIQDLFDDGYIHIDDSYDINEIGYDDGVIFEIEHHLLPEYVEEFEKENVESIALVFRQHESVDEMENAFYLGEITYEEYQNIQNDSVSELSDIYDYDVVVAVIINNERYEIPTIEMTKLIYENLNSLDNEIKDNLYDVYYEPNNNNVYFVDSGMAYNGDDEEAFEVGQIENKEIINMYV